MPGKAKKGSAKKAAAKKTAAKKSAAKNVPTNKSGAKKASANKSATATSAAKRAAARKAAAENGSPESYPIGPPSDKSFTKTFLKAQRNALVEERANYLRSALRLKAEADELASEREPGDVQFDEESGEGDTIAVERERDLALSAQAQETIAEIDSALERLADGTYGLCEASGLPIPTERLEAIPHARMRVEYKASRLGS